MLATIALALLLQEPCDVLLADSAGDQLARLADLVPDDEIRDLNEASPLWRESGDRTPRAVTVRPEGGVPAVWWIDSARDRIHRGEDRNGNGVIELFERTLVRDSGALDGASTARGLALTDDGAAWWCSDAGLRGLFRLRDLDGDGTSSGVDELEVLVGGTVDTHPIETSIGVRTMDARHLSGLAAVGRRAVAYSDGPDEALFAFSAENDDGDLLDPGESRLFLNASGKRPSLPRNADWESGRLRELAIPAPGGGRFYGRLSLLAVDASVQPPVWYLGCDSARGGPYDTNLFGQGLNGLIYRGVDLDGDGDLQEAGEVRRFYDGSHTAPQLGFDRLLALDVCGGALYVAFDDSGDCRVARLFDSDGSGDAEQPGEVELAWFAASGWQNEVPFEDAPPLIRDLAAWRAGDFADPNTLYESLGPGCEHTAGGTVPTLHGIGRAVAGTDGFEVELRGAAGGAYAFLIVGDDAPNFHSHLIPMDLGFFGLPGCKQYLSPTWATRTVTSGMPGDSTGGTASHRFRLPANPEIVGERMRMQWVVFDQFGGVAYSGGGEVVIESS